MAQIDSIRVYDTGYVCLLNEEGRVLYHPDLPIGSDPDQLGLSIHQDLLRKENSGEELICYTARGEDWQMSFSTLSNGMKLVTIAPEKEINAPWIRLIRAILMISAGVIVFYVILILLSMRVITRPLKQLTDASQRLADADYDVDLNYHGDNEIGTLQHRRSEPSDLSRQADGPAQYAALFHSRRGDERPYALRRQKASHALFRYHRAQELQPAVWL